MANLKSSKKRVLITRKETERNNDLRASMKTAIKKVEKSNSKEDATLKLNDAIKKIDNAYSKGIIKSNNRDRKKTRLNKLVNNI